MLAMLVLSAVLAAPQTVSFDLKDADLRDFLTEMGRAGDLNVVVHPTVSGKITLSVKDAAWQPLLEIVLKNYGLESELQGDLMRIVPTAVLETEHRQRAALEEARRAAAPLATRVIILNYARAVDVAAIVSRFLSPRGTVVVDSRKNAIIIRDSAP